MADINMPSGFGGLLSNEEYESRFRFSPAVVVGAVIVVVIIIILLRVFFPLS